MKLTIARSELFDALSVVSKGMSSRSTLPILSGILISSLDGEVVFQATDLEVSIKHVCPALIETQGQAVIPGKLLTDIVRSLPEAAVIIDTDGDTATVTCQQSSFTVKTLSPSDFPKFPEVQIEKSVVLPIGTLNSMIKKVSKAVSRDETRAVLTGILLVLDGPTVKMVATDSYRLAVCETAVEREGGEDIEVVIPGRAFDEAMRLASGDKNVTIGVSDNQIVFDLESTLFVTRRIEGSFPNYNQLVPQENETMVTVATEDFLTAVKRVSLLALHNTPLRISVNAEDQTLSLSATTQDVGDASEDLMAKVEGKDVEIAFNHTFLMDGLSSTTGDITRLDILSSLKPGLLRSGDSEKYLYLLMPVRLG